jgi:hypothetical protein
VVQLTGPARLPEKCPSRQWWGRGGQRRRVRNDNPSRLKGFGSLSMRSGRPWPGRANMLWGCGCLCGVPGGGGLLGSRGAPRLRLRPLHVVVHPSALAHHPSPGTTLLRGYMLPGSPVSSLPRWRACEVRCRPSSMGPPTNCTWSWFSARSRSLRRVYRGVECNSRNSSARAGPWVPDSLCILMSSGADVVLTCGVRLLAKFYKVIPSTSIVMPRSLELFHSVVC